MLFYIDSDYLSNFNIHDLKMPTEDDIFCYEYFKEGFLNYESIKYVPIYIHPLFNLNTLQTELLVTYFHKKPIREIKILDDVYTFISIVGLYNKLFNLPFLYLKKDKSVIRIKPFADDAQVQYRTDRYTDDFFFIGYCTNNININLLDLFKIVKYENKYYITIFGSAYYLYPFLELIMPSQVKSFNWTSANYYYNNNLVFDSIEVTGNRHLAYKTEEDAKFVLNSIRSTLFLNQLN